MKSKYTRSTMECPFNALTPGLVAAMNELAGRLEIGNLATEARDCFETTATRKGFFGLGPEPAADKLRRVLKDAVPK